VQALPYWGSCSTPPHTGPYSREASAALGFSLHEIEKNAFVCRSRKAIKILKMTDIFNTVVAYQVPLFDAGYI
jgi:hypothetical protein